MTGDQEERTQQKMGDLGTYFLAQSPQPRSSWPEGEEAEKGWKGYKVKSRGVRSGIDEAGVV